MSEIERKSKKDLALDILEILEQEGIDVSEMGLTRRVDGVKRKILLKEVRDDRINELIEKYGWDPNFTLGNQVYAMRTKPETWDGPSRERIERLGIKRKGTSLDQKSRPFKNQIQETLYILEQLREEGIDTVYIPQKVGKRSSYVSDIDSPKTKAIIRKLGLKEDMPIGKKIETIIMEYSENSNRHDYERTDKDRKRISELGIMNSYEENVNQTIQVLQQLKEAGIDVSSANKEVENEDGTKRNRYLYEIEDPNIEAVIEQLGLPKYLLIGQRTKQALNYLYKKEYPKEKRAETREQLIELGLASKERVEVNVSEALSILARLEELGIKTSTIAYKRGIADDSKNTEIRDVVGDGLEEILKEFEIGEDYPLGKRIARIVKIYNNKSYVEREDISETEKEQIEGFCKARQEERNKTVVQDTIKLIRKLNSFGIDINMFSLRPISKGGKQKTLELKDLGLTSEQLDEITEEFELVEDFAIGNRIINIRQAAKGNCSRIAITDEEIQELGDIGVLDKRDNSRVISKNLERIEMFKAIQDAGIDISAIMETFTQNGKSRVTELGMLRMTPEAMATFMERFGVDETYQIGSRKSRLKKAFRDGKLTPEQEKEVQGLGIVSELDELEREQRELESKLKEIEQLKAQVRSEQSKKRTQDIGE